MEMTNTKSARKLLEDLVAAHGRGYVLERTGLSKQYLSNLLRGAKPFGPSARNTFEESLGLPPGYFASGGIAPQERARVAYLPVLAWSEVGRVDLSTVEKTMPFAGTPSEHSFVLTIESDAMVSPTTSERSLPPGAHIVVDPAAPFAAGDFVVAQVPDHPTAIVRKVIEDGGVRYLAAVNPRYSELVKITAKVQVVGRVVAAIATF